MFYTIISYIVRIYYGLFLNANKLISTIISRRQRLAILCTREHTMLCLRVHAEQIRF